MKTVADIITEARERVDDEDVIRFATSTLRTWIYEGEKEIARRTECLRATVNIPVSADDQTVYGPTDVVRIHHAQFQPTGQNQIYPMDYRDRQSMDPLWGLNQAISTGAYPEFYTTWDAPPNLEITMAPIPSLAGTLTLFYYRLPEPISSSTDIDDLNELDVPAGWEDAVTSYVEMRCARKDRRVEDYTIAAQEFASLLSAIGETSIRYHDGAGSIDYDPMWPGFQGNW